jgi:hypothetical protein
MKKLLVTGILTIVTILFSNHETFAQKISAYECKWNATLPGRDEESFIDQMQFEEKSKFLFLFSNDEKNLYIDLITDDKSGIQKIMRYGLTTWFNPAGKHKKTLGIQFPAAPDENDMPTYRREKGGDRKEMMMAVLDRKNEEMVLIGFGGKDEQKVIDPRIDSSFHGKIEMKEGGKLQITLVVPLSKLDRTKENFNVPFSAGFETGYMDLNREGMTGGAGQGSGGGGDMHGGYAGGPPMGGGGPPSGSAGTGGQASGSGQRQQQPDISELASPSKLWISQVKLKDLESR